jgi:hypothetical protein
MKDLILMGLFITGRVAVMGMAAYLIYMQKEGWGWFLIVAFIFGCGTSLKVE